MVRPFLRHQVDFNREVLAVLVEVRDALAEDIRSLDARVGVGARDIERRLAGLDDALHGLATQLEQRGWAVDAMLPVLERRGYALEAAEKSLQELMSQVVELRGMVESGEREAFARLHDGIGALRRELGELTLSVEARFERLDARSTTDA
jgi:chromosome segregation ATPase